MQPQISAPPQASRFLAPSSSRMLASYVADLEFLLDEQNWEAALRDALELPLIAVALSDEAFRASLAALHDWCERWLPAADETQASAAEALPGLVSARLEQLHPHSAEVVPVAALRRLRLHRHVRTATAGTPAERTDPPDQGAAQSLGLCTALIEAARRWYSQRGCHDPIVQSNLARLAVLR